MQILNEKPPCGQIARQHRPTQEQVFEAVMKSRVAQIARASAEPDAEIFCDESPSPITSVDLKQIQRLARFLPVIVLIPRSQGHQRGEHGRVWRCDCRFFRYGSSPERRARYAHDHAVQDAEIPDPERSPRDLTQSRGCFTRKSRCFECPCCRVSAAAIVPGKLSKEVSQ
jgi:hypothetical protein